MPPGKGGRIRDAGSWAHPARALNVRAALRMWLCACRGAIYGREANAPFEPPLSWAENNARRECLDRLAAGPKPKDLGQAEKKARKSSAL
eukprot:1165840-Pyramimonas_sp.AAC.1